MKRGQNKRENNKVDKTLDFYLRIVAKDNFKINNNSKIQKKKEYIIHLKPKIFYCLK